MRCWSATDCLVASLPDDTLLLVAFQDMDRADQMQMTVKSKSREVTKAGFTLRQADGTPVDISLARQSPDFTRITVRVGTFGDEARSRQIIAKIKENL